MRKKELTTLDLAIIDYLRDNHQKSNPISMKRLATRFNLDVRSIRLSIERIILSQKVIIGNTNGYWVAQTEDEAMVANILREAKVKSSIELLFANGFKNQVGFHAFIEEMKAKYPKAPEGQIDIYGEQHSYYQN